MSPAEVNARLWLRPREQEETKGGPSGLARPVRLLTQVQGARGEETPQVNPFAFDRSFSLLFLNVTRQLEEAA